MPLKAIDFKVFQAAEEMNTWSSCPSAHRGMLLARIAQRLRTLPCHPKVADASLPCFLAAF